MNPKFISGIWGFAAGLGFAVLIDAWREGSSVKAVIGAILIIVSGGGTYYNSKLKK